MRRANRLSFMLRRGQALPLRTVLLVRPPLSAAEREAVAASLAEELKERGGACYESESEWEEMGDDAESVYEEEQGQEQEAAPAGDEEAGEEGTAGGGGSPAAGEGDDVSIQGQAEGDQEEAPSSSGYSSGKQDDAEQEAGGEPAPAAAPAQPADGHAEVLHLLRHLLLHTTENSFALTALEESADITVGAVQELRQDMEARFAALEKSIFYLMKQIGAPEPPPTKRRIGYSCGPKGKAAAARAVASNSDADTAEVAAVSLAAAPTASQAASRR